MPKTAGSWISRDTIRTSRVAAPLPTIFLDAVNVIFNSKAIVQLDSIPKFLCIIEKRDTASAKDIEEFKEAFWTQFPTDSNGYRQNKTSNRDITCNGYCGRGHLRKRSDREFLKTNRASSTLVSAPAFFTGYWASPIFSP